MFLPYYRALKFEARLIVRKSVYICICQVHHKGFITFCLLLELFDAYDHEVPLPGSPALGSGSNDRAWTMRGSFLLPSLNSSRVSLSSWFLSIWSNIFSTRFCGVFSSSLTGCWPYICNRKTRSSLFYLWYIVQIWIVSIVFKSKVF